MNVYEYEGGQEAALRGGLDVELGALSPGPVPADAITTRGRAIRRRRRQVRSLAGSVVAVVALGSSLLLPGMLRGAAPPEPVAPGKLGITVNSATYDAAHGLLGSGTVSGKAWSISMSHPPLSSTAPGGMIVSTSPQSDNQFTGTVAGSKSAEISSQLYDAPATNLLESIFWFGDMLAVKPPYYFGVGPVTQNVGSVVAHYANGDSVSYPATQFEGRRYVALLDVTTTTIDRLTAYGTDGAELGYVEPFSANGLSPQTFASTWYTPNQTPAFAPAAMTMAGTMFDSPGTAWTIEVRAGGFGVCAYTTPPEHFGGMECTPPGSPAMKEPIDASEMGNGDPAVIIVGPLDPIVTRVVATLTDGETAQMPLKTIDGKGMAADVFAPGKVLKALTAYESNGSVFAHLNWR